MKACTIADLHVDNWLKFNSFPKERIKQYQKLALRTSEFITENDCEELWLLGDQINNPYAAPWVVNYFCSFVMTVLEKTKVKKVVIILAQHDSDSKNISGEDSYLAILRFHPQIEIRHSEMVDYGGTKVFFQNWLKDDYIDPPECDIFISHVTIGFGQTVNDSKFKLGVFGDIHTASDHGNYYCHGTPFQHHAHEPQQGYLGIVDTDAITFTRYETDTEEYQFLKFEPTKKKVNNVNESVNRIIKRSNTDLISKIVEADLMTIHNLLTIGEIPEIPDMDYRITLFKANDFRSLGDFEMRPDESGKLNFFQGRNGSGKSSVMEALYVALKGDTKMSRHQNDKVENPNLSLIVDFEYQEATYQIRRYVGKTEFYIDGIQEKKKGKREIEAVIREYLPFIDYLDWFYLRDDERFFKKVNRIELVQTCFGLISFDYLKDLADSLHSTEWANLNSMYSEKTNLLAQISGGKEGLDKLREKLVGMKEIDLSKEDDLKDIIGRINNNQSELGMAKERKRKLGEDWKALSESISKVKLITVEEVKADLKNRKETEESPVKLRVAKRKVSSIEERMKKEIVCPKCDNHFIPMEDLEVLTADLEIAKKELSDLVELDSNKKSPIRSKKENEALLVDLDRVSDMEANLSDIVEDGKDVKLKIEKLETDLSTENLSMADAIKMKELIIRKKMILEQGNDLKQTLANKKARGRELLPEIDKQEKLVEEIERYRDMFDLKIQGSIPYQVLKETSESMSTEDIRFETTKTLGNGELRVDVSCSVRQGDTWRDYDGASAGERSGMDLFILERITGLIGPIGLLSIDEGFTNLDVESHQQLEPILDNMNVHNFVYSSHQLGFNVYDTKYKFEREKEGIYSEVSLSRK